MNENQELLYCNLNHIDNLHLQNNPKINQLISPNEAFSLLPMTHGDGSRNVTSLISPSRQLIKNTTNPKPKQRHERKKRRQQKYRGIISFDNNVCDAIKL